MATVEQVAPLGAREQRPWHAVPVAGVIRAHASRLDGLSDAEAQERLARFGLNRLPESKRRTALGRYLAQFNNLLTYVLLAAAAISAAMGHLVDASVSLAVVLVQTTLGFFQEGKAEQALEAIRGMLAPHTTVLRKGVRRTIPAEDLVPGDVVVLEPGDKVSADLRLVRAGAQGAGGGAHRGVDAGR